MSRLDDWIARMEAGETIDWGREAQLQALDIAKAGENFVDEWINREQQSDSEFQQWQ